MKSLRQKGLEEAQKQKYLDEIHAKPDVKKTFTICEVFLTFDWISNMIFFVLITIGVWENSINGIANAVDGGDILLSFLESVGGYYGLAAFFIVKALLGRLKKKYQAKLQVFEDAGIIEIEKQVAEGTYQPGPTVSKAYRIYRGIRTWSILLLFLVLLVGCFFFFV